MAGVKRMLAVGILFSIVFVAVGVIWLSNSAETLDQVAEQFGASTSPLWTPPIPEYEVPGFQGNLALDMAVGIVSTLLILVLTVAIGKGLLLLKRKA
jgi:hypothetical protein